MKKYYLLSFLVVSLFFVGCEKEYESYDVALPSFGSNSALPGTTPLGEQTEKGIEGIYTVTNGNSLFGNHLVFKFINNSLSIFGQKKGIYAVLDAGQTDTDIILEGYWRAANSGNTDLLRFIISKESGNMQNAPIFQTLSGNYKEDGKTKELGVAFERKITPDSLRKKMAILAHRAGGRTSDRMHVSENSVEMVLYTEHFGSTGIEIDIQLAKDSVPVVYHDSKLDIRLLQKSPIMGSISDYTYPQLTSLVRLYHGEKLPTLEEMLDAVVTKTKLRFVWLDIKEPSAMAKTRPIQERAMQKAETLGRDLYILQGLPSDEMVNAFMQIEGYEDILSLCELTLDDVRKTNSKVWAPRWTRGFQDSDVQAMHNEGRYAFVWTLDGSQYMEDFMKNSSFDGFLTNYPTLASYYYYTLY